jgi:hypothetical protein
MAGAVLTLQRRFYIDLIASRSYAALEFYALPQNLSEAADVTGLSD